MSSRILKIRKRRSTTGKPLARAKKDKSSVTRERALNVLADMRRNPGLTFTKAARDRGIDPRSVRKHIPSVFKKDSSGRIKVRNTDRIRQTLYIPTAKPGIQKAVQTKSSRERRLVGRWLAAVNSAGRGDYSKLKRFPKKQSVGGTRLPTGTKEIQRILNALAEEESPFEGLYRSVARPS